MKTWLIIPLVILTIAAATFGIYYIYQRRIGQPIALPPIPSPNLGFRSSDQTENPNSTPVPSISPNPNPNLDPSPNLSPNPQNNVLGTQPTTGAGQENIGIVVTSPLSTSKITSPVIIKGWTKIENGKIEIAVKDQDGSILGNTTTATCSNYQVCEFETELYFASPKNSTGTIEVYSSSQEDKELASILIQF